VTAITEAAVRQLAGFKAKKAPVTSCYLDVDGRRHLRQRDYLADLERMVKRARTHVDGQASRRDLERIEDRVKAGVDRSRTRGLVLFSCEAEGLWEVFDLPVPVHNHLVVNHSPHVRQLEDVLTSHDRFAMLLLDRQRARLLRFELGELVDRTELFDQLPRHDDDKGDWDRDHVRDHSSAAAAAHLRRVAAAALSAFQERAFDHLVLGGPDEVVAQLERDLHAYLRARVAAQVSIPVGASDDEIRQAAFEAEGAVERRRLESLVDRLRDAVGAGNGGVAGLDATLRMLVERRVETLLVSESFEAPGWRCLSCSWIGTRGRSCPVCARPMVQVDDVVEEAVEDALEQSCRVLVARASADLDVLGRIGGLLRY
jgi:peptide subunit release factor 1 (eRF1)